MSVAVEVDREVRRDSASGSGVKIVTDGKFLRAGDERFLVKGVAYGTFAPDAEGSQFPAIRQIAEDFRQMAALGVNTVRVYTPPRRDLLDEARFLTGGRKARFEEGGMDTEQSRPTWRNAKTAIGSIVVEHLKVLAHRDGEAVLHLRLELSGAPTYGGIQSKVETEHRHDVVAPPFDRTCELAGQVALAHEF